MQVVDEFLRAPHRERRNQHTAAACRRFADHTRQMLAGTVHRFMIAIAIRGFAENHVGATGRRFWIANDRQSVAPDVAREDEAPEFSVLARFDDHGRRSENMSGVDELCANAVGHFKPLLVRHADHRILGADGIGDGVQWLGVRSPMAFQKVRVLFLNVRGVGKHDRAEITRGRRRPDGALVSLIDQKRQPARMIDMRMRQHDAVDVFDGQRQFRVFDATLRAATLKQAAVQQNRATADTQEQEPVTSRAAPLN
jgi:hypothetical protein